MDWWPLAVAGVAGALALTFGIMARRGQRQIGDLHAEVQRLEGVVSELYGLLDLLAGPDPTLDELRESARRAAQAAGADLPRVES